VFVIVADPTTGSLKWQTTYGGPMIPYHDLLVSVDVARSTARGLDWTTGKTRWEVAAPDGAQFAPTARGFGPLDPALRPPAHAVTDNRLYEVDLDGTLVSYDGRTGQRTGRRANAMPALTAADTAFYLATDDTLYRIWSDHIDAYDLRGGDGVRRIYAT